MNTPLLPVFYDPAMAVYVDSFSPSALKPAEIVHHWQSIGLPMCLHPVEPIEEEDFYRVHDRRYVDGVLAGRIPNGFGSMNHVVTDSLFFTSGSLLSAARWALAHQALACSPTSGFHHASHDRGGSYCTFNGLMVTAAALKQEGLVQRVGILDLDCHYGNGTDHIIGVIGGHEWVFHFTAGQTYHCPEQVGTFFTVLNKVLERMLDCDLILYQAGADPHLHDPLGGWMTDDEIEKRDRLVFDCATQHKKPLVWNLAGGYQKDANDSIAPVLTIHTRTARAHLKALTSQPTVNTNLEIRGS